MQWFMEVEAILNDAFIRKNKFMFTIDVLLLLSGTVNRTDDSSNDQKRR